MKLQPEKFMSLLGCAFILHGAPLTAEDSDFEFTLSTGIEFTSGTYGGDADIEDTYVPLTATVVNGPLTFRLSVPYLSVRAPEGTIFDPDGQPLPGTGAMTTESGLGDIIGSVTVYDVLRSSRMNIAMDLTGKVKFGTADEDKGLGTGKNDYTVQADVYKFMDDFTLLGSIGYRLRGDPEDIDLDNVLIASLGGIYRFTPDMSGGLFFDFRESAISGNDSIQELSAFVSRRISENWKLQFCALTGCTDSSPDWGGGIQVKRFMEL